MMKKILFCIVLLILIVIFVGCFKNINQNNESTNNTNQQDNIEKINIHEVQNYDLERCHNVGAKEIRNDLSCECVEYPQFDNIWVCNNKVVVGNSYMSLDTFRKNKCSILLMEMPGCGLVDGEIKCGGFYCQKDTLVFSEVSQTSEPKEEYFNITSISSESVTFEANFGSGACNKYKYKYIRDNNNLKIILTDLDECMWHLISYRVKGTICNLEKGKYDIILGVDSGDSIKEIFKENIEIK